MAPGRLENCQSNAMSKTAPYTYLNIKMARVPPENPLWIVFIQKSIFTLAEPGRAWLTANICWYCDFISEVFRVAWKSGLYRWLVDPL